MLERLKRAIDLFERAEAVIHRYKVVMKYSKEEHTDTIQDFLDRARVNRKDSLRSIKHFAEQLTKENSHE